MRLANNLHTKNQKDHSIQHNNSVFTQYGVHIYSIDGYWEILMYN